MLLIDKQKYIQGVNFQQGMPYTTIKQLMSTNAQYIVELAYTQKM